MSAPWGVKLAFFFTAYLGQHTPVGFIWLALPVIFRESSVSLSRIGFIGLLYTPWALKFLYASVVDRFTLPFSRPKKAWLILGRLIALCILLFLSFTPPETGLPIIFTLVFLMNTAFALCDIALDGISTDSFAPQERSWGAGIQMTANFFGFMVGGGLFLILFQQLGWNAALRVLSLYLFLLSLPLLWIKETACLKDKKKTVDVWSFVNSRKTLGFFLFLALMALILKTGYQLRMTLLIDIGFSPQRIGTLILWAGSPVAISGTFLGSYLARTIRASCLFMTGCIIAAAVAGLSWLVAKGMGGQYVIVLTIGLEQLLMGTVMSGIYALIQSNSAGSQSSTNFGILCGVQHLTTFLAFFCGGLMGQYLGYKTVFALLVPLSLFAALPLYKLFRGVMKPLDTILLPTTTKENHKHEENIQPPFCDAPGHISHPPAPSGH